MLDQPDRSTRQGVRDSVLLSVLCDTRARVQELVTLRMCDINLTEPASVLLTRKGRKSRLVPLMASTVKLLKLNNQSEGLVDDKTSERTLFLRAGDRIKSHFWLFRGSPSKARGGRIAGYSTDDQRSGVRCMDEQKCDFILSPALILSSRHISGHGSAHHRHRRRG